MATRQELAYLAQACALRCVVPCKIQELNMDDRAFWLAVYRAVMALAAAIKKYKVDPPSHTGNGHRPVAGYDSEITSQTPPIDHA